MSFPETVGPPLLSQNRKQMYTAPLLSCHHKLPRDCSSLQQYQHTGATFSTHKYWLQYNCSKYLTCACACVHQPTLLITRSLAETYPTVHNSQLGPGRTADWVDGVVGKVYIAGCDPHAECTALEYAYGKWGRD